MKLNELEGFPELGNTIVIDGIEYVKKREPLREDLREGLREEVSLRDHFAGLAMQGSLARACPNVDTLAQFAYGIADKMLAERERKE